MDCAVGLSVFDQPSDDSFALHIQPLLRRSEKMRGGDGFGDQSQERQQITLELMLYKFHARTLINFIFSTNTRLSLRNHLAYESRADYDSQVIMFVNCDALISVTSVI